MEKMKVLKVKYYFEDDFTEIVYNKDFETYDRITKLDILGDSINLLKAKYDAILRRKDNA